MDTELRMVLTTERVTNMRAMIFICLFVLASVANAADLSIIEIRRNIPLSDDEPVIKDYYISGGSSAGLKKDHIINIERILLIKDGQEPTKITVPVGRLRVLFVDETVAVARLFEKQNREGLPMIEQPGFLVGDRVKAKPNLVEKTPYKFLEDTSRIQNKVEKFALNGSPFTSEISIAEAILPRGLNPEDVPNSEPVSAASPLLLPVVKKDPEETPSEDVKTTLPIVANGPSVENSPGPSETIRQ